MTIDMDRTPDRRAAKAYTDEQIAEVEAGSLSDGSVTTPKIAADAVTGANIADDAVDTEHLAAGAVDATALDDALASRIPTVVRLGTDRGVTSSTTLADTTGLSFPVEAGKTYYIDGHLLVTGDTSADLKVGFTHPGGNLFIDVLGYGNYSSTPSNVQADNIITASGGSQSHLGTLTGLTMAHRVMGTYECTTSGTFQMQHAQRVSNGTPTTIKAGSWLRYHT